MEAMMQYPPGDTRMIDKIVHQLKSQGIFDQFRKECLADVDTKPAYQNLHQRVEGSVSGFLASQEWRPDLNKNQLRDSLRKHIHESGFLDIGVERIVDQVVNPKIMTVFMPQVEDVVYKFLGIEKPKKGKENQNVFLAPLTVENLAKKEQKKLPTLTDLLPKELEPISPESDTLKGKEDNSLEDGEVGFGDEKEEEDSSPPFEPIERVNSHVEESSMDSHLSGISELTSHDSQHSHSVFNTTAAVNIIPSKPTLDFSNNDSQLSKVSSGSRLSIVSLGEQDFKLQYDAESNDESQQTKSPVRPSYAEGNVEGIKDIELVKDRENHETSIALSEESNSSSNRLQIYTQENSENNSLDVKEDGEDETDGHDRFLNEISENNGGNEFDKVPFEINIENKSAEIEEYASNKEFTQTLVNDMPVKDEITEDKVEIRTEENLYVFQQEMSPESIEESIEKKPEVLDTKHEEKLELASEKYFSENFEKKLYEKLSVKAGELHERKLEDKSDRHERKVDEKTEKKSIEKKSDERKCDEKGEKKSEEKHDRKVDEKSEKKSEKKYEKQSEKKIDRKTSDKSEKKVDEKSSRKSDDKSTRKTDEKKANDKKSDDRSDRKVDERKCTEKKSDEKGDRKIDDKTDRKPDSKTEKKHDKHREEREKSKDRKDEKKRVSSESKDSKKIDSSHSSESDKTKSDKDKHKKDHGENRSRSEKSNKHDSKETKDKSKREDKTEKEKSKYEVKDIKDEKKAEEKDKKSDKDSGREKSKKEETEISKHDKEVKKSRSDDKKERDGKEKQKAEDKGKTKHDDKHRERIKSEGKEKSSRHDDKSKEGSRSSSKENKDRSKQDMRDKGKETQSKSDEKKNKEKSKHEEKSNKPSEKGTVKKSESKSRSSDHKSKDSGKKNKDSKGKSITDDHRIHRDKHSEDRRSADRDSNGTAHDRPIGNTTSHTNGSDSQPSQSRREKSGSTSTSSKSDSGGNSDSCMNSQSESSRREESYSPSKSSSPPSSLPFKKRPLSIQSDDEHSDNERLDKSPKPLLNKIKKPKIAANIFEVKKIMMLRKSLAKKERRQQRELQKIQEIKDGIKGVKSEKKVSKPIVTKRKKLGDVEKSLRKEVHTSLSQKQIPVDDVEKEDISEFKYFESEIIPYALNQYDSQFLAYVKKLGESDNLSDISTPSDSESEVSETDDVIRLSSIDFDEQVAKELGARFVKSSSKGIEVVFGESSDREVLKRRRASMEAVSGSMVDFNIVGDTVVTLNVSSRSNSVMSNWSEKSADDCHSVGNTKRRRDRSSSVTSTNSNKSISDKIAPSSNGLNSERQSESSLKSRKRVFSRKRPKRDLPTPPEIKPIEKRELRRARKPSTRYSSKEFASYTDEDNSCDRVPSEQIPENNEEGSHHELKSDLIVVLNDFKSTATKFSGNGSHEDDNSSDGEVILECVGDGYIIRDNNNVDKGSSEDERGCGDGSMLNQDLILPTLRDLMVESGFRREDDKSDILPSLAGVGNCVTNSGEDTNEKQVSSDTYDSRHKVNSKRTNLGRSRRVGLSRPRPKVVTEQGNNEVAGNRTATPPDFVMPLSPESDVSASSGEAKKGLPDKVGESHCDPSASNSDDKTAHVSNSRLGDSETRRSLRSGGLGTPGGRGQRYNSDDLYKPRPLFSQGSRRIRGRMSPPLNEDVPNCTNNLMSNISETPLSSAKKRR